jgi:hypothetical protein
VKDKFGNNCQNQDLFTLAKSYGMDIGKNASASNNLFTYLGSLSDVTTTWIGLLCCCNTQVTKVSTAMLSILLEFL